MYPLLPVVPVSIWLSSFRWRMCLSRVNPPPALLSPSTIVLVMDQLRFSASLRRPAADENDEGDDDDEDGADAAAEWCDRHVSGVAAAFPCEMSSYVTWHSLQGAGLWRWGRCVIGGMTSDGAVNRSDSDLSVSSPVSLSFSLSISLSFSLSPLSSLLSFHPGNIIDRTDRFSGSNWFQRGD